MNDLSDCLSPLKISVAKASVLMVIERNEGIKLVNVGDCLDIKRANITPMITELETRGLVLRTIEGRAHALKLSKRGERVVGQVRQLMAESEERCFGHLNQSSRDTLNALLLSVRSSSE
jgi:DNA-binding MarR family transcriptional regulator